MKTGEYIVFYDAQCAICRRSRKMLEALDKCPPLRFIDVNDRREMAHWPMIDRKQALKKVTVLTPQQKKLTAYDAVIVLLAGRSRIIRLLRPLLETRIIRAIGQWLYNLISHNRYGLSRILHLEHDQVRA